MTQVSPQPGDGLQRWLSWLELLHPTEIDLGLPRVAAVAKRCGLYANLPTIITVGGTNGKGSVVALVSNFYAAAGSRVGAYTSPHLIHFNERIVVDGQPASDQQIVSALHAIEQHRGEETLTYFEATTLAAMSVFVQQEVDIAVLEVGLGGRHDAVNIWDSDCAVITSIALDHQSWLGNDRASIAAEKIEIARPDRPLIIAEPDPPGVLSERANEIGAQVWQSGKDYSWRAAGSDWLVSTPLHEHRLPRPVLPGLHQYHNTAAAIAVVDAMHEYVPVSDAVIGEVLSSTKLAGRLQHLQWRGVPIVLDVAHNPAAATALAASLAALNIGVKRWHGVFAAMADKDISGVVQPLSNLIHAWYCAALMTERALPAPALAENVKSVVGVGSDPLAGGSSSGTVPVAEYDSVEAALAGAMNAMDRDNDGILVFGSFYTVSAALQCIDADGYEV